MAQDFADHMAALRSRAAENSEVARQQATRPQPEIDKNPSYFQRRQEQENKSTWSGGVWGGRVDRSR